MIQSFRLIGLLACSGFRGDADPYATHVTRWRVLPTEIDAFGHMNNGRYQAMMDLARIDYLLRCGYFTTVVRRRWAVPVGAVRIDYRASLKPLSRYELHTRVVHWDDRWFYFRHDFFRADRPDRPACTAFVSTLFRGRGGSVPTAEVIRAFTGGELAAPDLPEELHEALRVGALPPAAA